MIPSICNVNKPYRDADSFNISVKYRAFFNPSGRLVFPAENYPLAALDGGYRTKFGPSFVHNGVVYANCNHNLSLALTRLTAARDDVAGISHEELMQNQHNFIYANSGFIKKIRRHIHSVTRELIEREGELIDLVNKPHPKKPLRERALNDVLGEGSISKQVWNLYTEGKVKRAEYGKNNKYPRLVNDLTVKASLQGAVLTTLMKEGLASRPIMSHGATAQFVKSPSRDALTDVFRNLLNPKGAGYFVYFSDDACLSLVYGGKRHMFNMDISSCDASHTEALFDMLKSTTTHRARQIVDSLVAQCNTPLVIKSVKGKQKVIMKPKYTRLYSGSTLTTLINNYANLLIFESIFQRQIGSPEDIIAAARAVGYNVTLTECHCAQELQFLKHSPIIINDDVVPMINVGVILRALGACHGDLPGSSKIPFDTKARTFMRGLVSCFVNTPRHALLNILIDKWGTGASVRTGSYLLDGYHGTGTDYCSVDNVISRYGITTSQYNELCELTCRADLGDTIRCVASDRILELDYGL